MRAFARRGQRSVVSGQTEFLPAVSFAWKKLIDVHVVDEEVGPKTFANTRVNQQPHPP